jgi:hypothetical protein
MKNLVKFMVIGLFVVACGQKTDSHEHHSEAGDALSEAGTEGLYNEVMKVHDEVMPKMDDLYKAKERLKDSIANTPDLAEAKKQEIELLIAELDSASDGMMIWMRQFQPLEDSLGEEKAREYLENEMERVKKVREDINEALSKASPNASDKN